MSRAYQNLVHLQLEHAAEALNPSNISTADCLEHIQCQLLILFTMTIDDKYL